MDFIIKKMNKELLLLAAALCVMLLMLSPAYAASDKYEVDGLPQLDVGTYSSQFFWMIVIFSVLYFFFARKTLPEISGTIDNRKNHIQSDLETAETLAAEADKVHEGYQSSLNSSQSKAAKEISSIEEKMKAENEKAAHDFRARSDKELKAAEANILDAQEKAMSDINMIAAEAASVAVAKIIGGKTDVKKAQIIVEDITSKNSNNAKAA